MAEKVLVYGSGGRDHCLADEYIESPHVDKVYFAPGNPGINFTKKGQEGLIERVQISDFNEVVKFCEENNVTLVDVGSESPLDAGLVDILNKEGIPAVGPIERYVRIENDRAFTHEMLKRINVPLPEYRIFDDAEEAMKYVRNIGYQVVPKANGLATGKGAIVCEDVNDAEAAIDTIMIKKKFGESGERIVIEERKYGTEISFFAYLDGKHVLPLRMFAQDYKPAFDPGDELSAKALGGNLNTGGTGCICPHPKFSPWLTNKIIKDVVNPTVNEIYNGLGWNYKGVLYFGLNLDPFNKLDVFEINVRWGDPEAEVILRKLKTDIFEIGMAVQNGTLDQIRPKWNDNHYADVIAMVGRSKSKKKGWYPGYPKRYGKGYKIEGLGGIERGVAVFYAGVDEHPERGLVTEGGRVLHVVASGFKLEDALEKAYKNIDTLKFVDHNNNGENCLRYRKTIGREQSSKL